MSIEYTYHKRIVRRGVIVGAFVGSLLCFLSMHVGRSMSAYFQGDFSRLVRRQAPVTMLGGVSMAPSSKKETFPAFECAIDPFPASPHWGTMRSDEQLDRSYTSINPTEYIPTPAYDMTVLTRPLKELNQRLHTAAAQDAITAKLFYSTRYMGPYDLDAAEYSILGHPAIDIKMPEGAPLRAIAGGRVDNVRTDPHGFGLYVVIKHRLPDTGESVFSIYGHMKDAIVQRGDDVRAGQMIGTVGNTGNSTRAHLQLQIDRDRGESPHTPYVPGPRADRAEILSKTIHPIEFIKKY